MSEGWPQGPKLNYILSVDKRDLNAFRVSSRSLHHHACPLSPPLTAYTLFLTLVLPTQSRGPPTVGSPAWGVAWVKEEAGGRGRALALACPGPAGEHPEETKAVGRQTGAGGLWAGLKGPLAPATGCLSPCQGPVGLAQALGPGRGGSVRGPRGQLHPVTQPLLGLPREDNGGLWVLGGPPGRCEPQGGLGLREELSKPQCPHLYNGFISQV